MIDYDKLKKAHDLSAKIKSHYLVHITSNKGHEFTLVDWKPDMADMTYKDLDDLLQKLQELTKPEPKFKIGQKLWYHIDVDIYSFKVDKIYFCDKAHDIMYSGEGDEMCETHCYPSKHSLIKAQIGYWQGLSLDEAHKEIMENELNPRAVCHHESDGHVYPLKHPPEKKCKKCGEFYR